MYVQYFWNVLYLTQHSINVSFPYIFLMTTCFINIVNMFFNIFLKNVLKTRKRFKNQSPIKLLFKTFLKTLLGHFKNIYKMSNC